MKLSCAIILTLSLSTTCGNILADIQKKINKENVSKTSKKIGINRAPDVFTMNQYMDKVIATTISFIDQLKLDPITLTGDILDFHAYDPSGTYKTGVLSITDKHVYGISSMTRNGDVQITYLPDSEIEVNTVLLINKWQIKELLNFRLDNEFYSGEVLINQGASNFSVSFKMSTNTEEIYLKSIELTYYANPMYFMDYDPPVHSPPWLIKGLEEKLIFDLYGLPAGRMMQILRPLFMDIMADNPAP